MRTWVCALGLACGQPPTPEVVKPPPEPSVATVETPQVIGPSRRDVVALLDDQVRVRAPFISGSWVRVGDHLGERILKRVCGGQVPRLGLNREGDGGRIHAFDGHHMQVYEILGIISAGDDVWRVWVVPMGAQQPVHTVSVTKLDAVTTRWRSATGAPDWADGAEWVQGRVASNMAEVEQLDCRPAPR